MREIERKFIATHSGNASGYPWSRIIQGYMAVLPDGTEFRLREESPRLDGKTFARRLARIILWLVTLFFYKPDENRYTLTVKSGGGKERDETEIEISRKQFNELWPLAKEAQVRKIRCRIPHGRLTIERDVYTGLLDGLVIAEVEFRSARESEQFVPPEWFGEEVTEDKRYKNKNLALHGLPKK